VETPPVETPPVETPESPTSPGSPESPTSPVERRSGGGGVVLPQEQGVGGAVGGEVTQAAPAAGTLPFTGSPTPLLMLLGAALAGLGVGLRRMTTERG
jgi:hypothetical protein